MSISTDINDLNRDKYVESPVGSGQVAVAVVDSTTSNGVSYAVLNASSSGATTVVAAVANKRIRVLQVIVIANSTVNVKFQSHVTPTDISGLLYLAANTGFNSGYCPGGQFQTISGEALDINLSGNVAVGGWVVYTTV